MKRVWRRTLQPGFLWVRSTVGLYATGAKKGELTMSVDCFEDALHAVARGEIVLVVDDGEREGGGELMMAAELADARRLAFFVRHTSGLICTAIMDDRAAELNLPLMVERNTEAHRIQLAVTVDYRHGTSTGRSIADRVATVRALVDPGTQPADLTRPGHLHVLRAREGGVLRRAGHTEAAVDLARLAGLQPAGVLCEVVTEDGLGMARRADLERFAKRHQLRLITVADLIRYRLSHESLVRRTAEAELPTEWGTFHCRAYDSVVGDETHLALVMGEPRGADAILVWVHHECFSGDVFASGRCDCANQLRTAMRRIADARLGVVVYLRGNEGGVGIPRELQDHQFQDGGLDTVPSVELGLPMDSWDYRIGAHILVDLGVRTLRLITNGPPERDALEIDLSKILEQV
jgi:3,4-dihydroxy 2-butanone 4-phosphate synthase/GTP cyclohydrolase II